jgi:hypothetical protein
MRIVRIVLQIIQIIIVCMVGILLLAVIIAPKKDFAATTFAFLLFAILFAVTSWLKHVTEKRLSLEKTRTDAVLEQPTPCVPEKTTESWWRFKYVKRKPQGQWLALTFYIFVLVIPLFYEYRTEIPPDETLIKTEGVFFYKHAGRRRGYIVELSDGEKKENFTCRENMFLGIHTCFYPEDLDFGVFNGKTATVWWFDQEIYPFVHQRRLVRLAMNDEELVSRAKTIADAEASIRSNIWCAVGFFVFMITLTHFA